MANNAISIYKIIVFSINFTVEINLTQTLIVRKRNVHKIYPEFIGFTMNGKSSRVIIVNGSCKLSFKTENRLLREAFILYFTSQSSMKIITFSVNAKKYLNKLNSISL